MKNKLIDIPNSCLLCKKLFNWNEVIVGKPIDQVFFCMNCITKFEDNNEYKGIKRWAVLEYIPGRKLQYTKPGENEKCADIFNIKPKKGID